MKTYIRQSVREDWRKIQQHLGIVADGIPLKQTAKSVAEALDISLVDDLEGSASLPLDPEISNRGRDGFDAVSPKAIELIRHFESLMVQLPDGRIRAYRDPVGIPTIGWGSIRNEDTGVPIQMGDIIAASTAERWFQMEISDTAKAVDRMVKVPLTREQRGALISFAYNAGTGALAGSTLLRLLNRKDYVGAAKQFERWVYGTDQRGKKVKLRGLQRRRASERNLFEGDTNPIVPA